MFNEISFPSHVGLPFEESPPTVDGFTEPHPGLPLTSWRLEPGYVGAPKFAYDGSGAAHPSAMFQGVKDAGGPFLYLAFDVRFDPAFNDGDRVMIILRPAFSTAGHTEDERRIDILPVGAGGGGAPATPADPEHDLVSHNYRSNRPPTAREIYKRNPAGSATVWQNITGSVTNLKEHIRVSSSAPTGGAKNWTVELRLPLRKVAILGEDEQDFGGGPDWIDISDDFGLYVNLMRLCSGAGCAGPEIGGFFSTQFTWPWDPEAPTTNVITDPATGAVPEENWDVPAAALGRARILAPGATNPSQGVKFKGSYLGIGLLQPDSSIGGTLDLSSVGQVNNVVARLINDHPTDDAEGVTAEFRLADFWGMGPYGNGASWGKTPSTPNPAATPPVDPAVPAVKKAIPAGGATAIDIASVWTTTQAHRDKYASLWWDQCLWVNLSSSAGANIVEQSTRRNLTVKTASELRAGVGISGELPTSPADGSDQHDYWLHTMKMRLEGPPPPPQRGPSLIAFARRSDENGGSIFDQLNTSPLLTGELVMADRPAATWLWVSVGYWRTSETLTVGGNKYAIWIHAGNFAAVVQHPLKPGQTPDQVDVDVVLTGSGLDPTGEAGLVFRVPHKGTKRLETRIRAGTPEELKELEGPWWLRLLRWLWMLILRLLRKLFRR
jgi:hypothetical protein